MFQIIMILIKKKRLQIFVPLLSLIFVSKPKHCTFQTEIELLISEDVSKRFTCIMVNKEDPNQTALNLIWVHTDNMGTFISVCRLNSLSSFFFLF